MRLLARISVLLLLMGAGTGLLALQRGGYQQDNPYGDSRVAFSGDSDNGNGKSEYSWSRLRYTSAYSGGYGYGFGRGNWSTDYPKADRQFLIALRRLTRIQARPTEQVVDLDSDARGSPIIFNFPWVYAVQVQTWTFTEPEAKLLREYLLKGGFLMVDDFHGATIGNTS